MKRKKWLKLISSVGTDLLVTSLLVEAILRLFPVVIPAALLVHFGPGLRAQIAAGRFPTVDEAVPFVRDDGGFPFSVWKPFAKINYSFRDIGSVNTVTMDEMGFCNAPNTYSQAKIAQLKSAQANSLEVVVLGDSFIWCTAVHPEETWVAQLGQQTGLSTYNLGEPGTGLYEHLQLLKRFGLPKQPKVVILSIYEGNDLRDALKYHTYRATGQVEGESSPVAAAPAWQRVPLLGRYGYLWNSLGAIATQWQRTEASPSGARKEDEDNENFRYQLNFKTGSVPFNLENGDRDEVTHAKMLANREVSLELYSEALTQFMKMAQAHDFIPIVTYTPSAYTAYAKVVAFDQAGLATTLSAYSQQQRDFFADRAAALGYEFIDFTPVLQTLATDYNSAEKLLYYPTNRHLTRYGHAAIAESLTDVITAAVLNAHPN